MINQDDRKLLRYIQMMDFVTLDAALFLDTHPNNTQALNYFNQSNEMAKRAREKYARECRPLTLSQVNSNTEWTWQCGPMPWELEA